MAAIYLRGRTWWCRTDPVTGKRCSTGCTGKQAAELWFQEREKLAANPAYAAAHAATLGDWAAKLVADKEQTRPQSVTMYRVKIGHAVRIGGEDMPLVGLTPGWVDSYIAQRDAEGAMGTTIGKELTAITQLAKLAKRAGCYDGDPTALRPYGYRAGYKPRERFLAHREEELLRRHLTPQEWGAVCFAICTGARAAEIARARLEDWDPRRHTFRLRGTKTSGSKREVPVLSLFSELWPTALERLPYTGMSLNRPLRRAVERLRREGKAMANVTPNDLRRTCATRMVAAGIPFDVAAKVLGHGSTHLLHKVYGRLDGAALRELAEQAIGRRAGTKTSQSAPVKPGKKSNRKGKKSE